MPEYSLIPSETIVSKIYIIRNRKVMLDRDLAKLYGVQTKVLNQAVKRNVKRFPPDFMFQLTVEEFKALRSQIVILEDDENLKSQIVTSSWGGSRTFPFAFTEQGVAMLSSVLNSDKAIEVNIQIIRTFTQLRELLATNEALHRKIMELEKRYDKKLQEVFSILQLLVDDGGVKKQGEIGFKAVKK